MNTGVSIEGLADLQSRQREHDVLAHQDILALPVDRRLTHFTLHFAKYHGQLLRAVADTNRSLQSRLITDSFIIALAMANALGVRLPARFRDGSQPDVDTLLREYGEVVGRMAKACEAFDHSEVFPSQTVLKEALVELLGVIAAYTAEAHLDLVSLVSLRWREVEDRASALTPSRTKRLTAVR